MSEQKEKRKFKLSRRGFLIAVGVAGGGLLLGVKVGVPFARLRIAEVFESAGGPPATAGRAGRHRPGAGRQLRNWGQQLGLIAVPTFTRGSCYDAGDAAKRGSSSGWRSA